MHPAFRHEVRNNKYEKTDDGQIYLPQSKVLIGGYFGVEAYRAGEILYPFTWEKNIVVDEGLQHILDVVLHGTTAVNPWYVGIFEGNYTPLASDTGTTISSNATESNKYDELTRREYVEAAASSAPVTTTNSANKATFTISATVTIYGAFLHEAEEKTADAGYNVGTLLAASKFSSARSLVDDDELLITYSIVIDSP